MTQQTQLIVPINLGIIGYGFVGQAVHDWEEIPFAVTGNQKK